MTKVHLNEPVVPEERKAMTAARKVRVLAKSDGHCAYPECAETAGLQFDHVIPLELGGKDDVVNMQALCTDHHKQKTRTDVALIARAKRRRAFHTGTRPETRAKLKSRGFQRSRPEVEA